MFLIVFLELVRVAWREVVIQPDLSDLVSPHSLAVLIQELCLLPVKDRCLGALPVRLVVRVVDHHAAALVLVLEARPRMLAPHFLRGTNDWRSAAPGDKA